MTHSVLPQKTDGHVHEFIRFKTTAGEFRWKCNDPDCFAIFDRQRVSGKRTVCTKCHSNQFILTAEQLGYAKPVCDHCSNDKRAKERLHLQEVTQSAIQEILDETGELNVHDTQSDAFYFGETSEPLQEDDGEHRKER